MKETCRRLFGACVPARDVVLIGLEMYFLLKIFFSPCFLQFFFATWRSFFFHQYLARMLIRATSVGFVYVHVLDRTPTSSFHSVRVPKVVFCYRAKLREGAGTRGRFQLERMLAWFESQEGLHRCDVDADM